MKENKSSNLDTQLKIIAKTSLFVFIATVLAKIFSYVYRIIIARYFGAEIYGLFSLAIMIIGWFVAFSSFGLVDGIVRYIPFYRGKNQIDKARYVFRFALKFLIISAIISGILLFFLAETISIKIFHDSRLIIFLKIFSISLPFYILMNAFLSTLRAFEKIVWYSFIVYIFQTLSKVVILAVFIFLGVKINSVAFSYFLGIFATFVASYFACRRLVITIFKKPFTKKNEKLIFRKVRKELLLYSWPLLFSGFFAGLFYWEDTLMIGYFKTVLEVGLYNAAVPIVFLFNFVQDLFMSLFLPLVTREFSKKNISIVREISKQVGKWIFVLILPLFFILLVFPEQIINLLFGSEFVAASTALRILAIGGFFSFLLPLENSLLFMIGKSKLMLANLVSLIVLNFILNALFIPRWGINGAAIATTISWIIFTLIVFFEIKNFLSIIPLRRKMLRILLVSLIPLLILISVKRFVELNNLSFVLLGLFFFLLYLILIFATKCLDRNDLSVVSSIKRKLYTKGH